MRLIIAEEEGTVSVSIRWSEDGERERQGGATPFAPPLDLKALEELRFYLEDYLQLPSGLYATRGEAVEREKLAAWGEALFREVFEHSGTGPERRNAYVQLRAAATRGERAELSIASLNPRFLSLPWELLKAPEDARPIALDIASFDRTLPQPAPAFSFPDAAQGIRILMVIARPDGVRDAPFQSIARRLFRHVGDLGEKVRAEVLRPPSFAAFQRRLREANEAGEPFHIVHFDGHGTFGAIEGAPSNYSPNWFFKTPARQGYLCFETEGGTGPELVAAGDFAAALRAGRTPCVVLNACRAGTLDTADDAVGPEGTVATRLIAEGIASVVAMTHSVYVVAASAFMATFYERLFSGLTVSEALNDARRALTIAPNDQRPSLRGQMLPLQDWMVPVHYQRTRIRLPGLGPRSGPRPAADAMAAFRARIADQGGRSADATLAPMDGVFLGRDAEFYRLERLVAGVQVGVLHGVGGTGKTELAKAFARWLQLSGGLDDPSLVFFESFEPGRAGFGVDQVILPIFTGLTEGDGNLRLENDTPEQREALVLRFLREARCLLVWDNFETAGSMPAEHQATPPLDEAGRARISAFLKAMKGGRSAVIITSRSAETWLEDVTAPDGRPTLTPGDAVRIEVGGLGEAEALDYANHLMAGRAQALAHRAADQGGFAKLLGYLTGHPLCLKLALRHLDSMPPGALLAALRGEAAGLPEGLTTGRLAALGACVRYSLHHLDPADRERLFILALAEDSISAIHLALMTELQAAAPAERSYPAPDLPARLGGLDGEGWTALLERAADLGLIAAVGGGIYRLHPALPVTLTASWREAAGESYPAEREAAEGAFLAGAALFGQLLLQAMQGGAVQAGFLQVRLQQRALEALLGACLRRGAFDCALAILRPLDDFWDAAGLSAAATAWSDRVIREACGGSAPLPQFDSEAGALWRFARGAEANRILLRGKLDDADKAYKEILAQVEDRDTPAVKHIEATSYHQIGAVAQARHDLDAAQGWYERSLALLEEIGDRAGMAKSYHQLGVVAHLRHDLDAAQGWYERSLALLEEIGDRASSARSYHQLGIVAQERHDLDAAQGWYERSLALAEEIGDRAGMASSYHHLGIVAQDRHDLDAAQGWYERSLALKEKIGDRAGMARSYHQLGVVAQLRHDLDAAQGWYERGLALVEEIGDRAGMASSYHQLGMVAQERHDLDAAQGWYERSLALLEEIGDRAGAARSWAQLGRLAQARGLITEAFDGAVRALILSLELPDLRTSAPFDLADLTEAHGEAMLAERWTRVTGELLPEVVRDGVRHFIANRPRET